MKDTAVVEFISMDTKYKRELEVPLDISADDMIEAISQAFQLPKVSQEGTEGYLIGENPIAFLHGRKTLREYGIHNGSILIYQGERE